MKNPTNKLLIILAILLITCNHQETDVSQQSNTLKQDTTKYKPPTVIKINKDSLPVFTPGENGVPLPKVVKAGEPEIYPIPNLPIIPGESYLPQTKEEIAAGKKPAMSKKPKVVILDTSKLVVLTSGKDSIKMPKVYKIYQANDSNLVDNKYTIQHGDTIYPPKTIIYPYPEISPVLPPRYKDKATKNIQYLDVEAGLSFPQVWDILEDKSGNIWLTSNVGISKYDGKVFTHFTNKHGFDILLVRSLLEDKKGNIWFGTWGYGVFCYDGHSFTQFTTKQGLCNNSVWSILEDKNGNIWFGTSGGISCYDGKSITNFTTHQGLSSNYVTSILEDKRGKLWIGLWPGGVSCYDGKSFTNYGSMQGLIHNNVLSICEDKNGKIWLGRCCGAVSCYDGKSFIFYGHEQGLAKGPVRSIIEDSSGNIWFGNKNGATCYNGKSFTRLTTEQGLSNNSIWSILEDKNGKLWFGTGGGMSIFDRKSINHITTNQGLNYAQAMSIMEDKSGKIWFTTNNEGLFCNDGQSIIQYTTEQGLISNDVSEIVEDKNGNIWFGTNKGLCRFDGNYFTYYTTKQGLSSNRISRIIVDKNGNLWFGTGGSGVNCFDGKSFTHFTANQGYRVNFTISIFEDKNGKLWFGTFKNGLICFDGNSFINYTTVQGLSDNWVGSIHEDKKGKLWLGTNNGLSCYDGHSFTRITTEQGLSSKTVTSITRDKNNNLWIGTAKGLDYLILDNLIVKKDTNLKGENVYKSPEIYNFGTQDGLKGLHCWFGSAYLDSKNRFWFATQKALSVFDLNQFKLPRSPPGIQLNSVEIQENFIDYRLLKDSNSNLPKEYSSKLKFSGIADFYNYPLNLKLPYKLNHLTFHFSAIDWAAPHKLRYQYKLQGFDNQWSQLNSENKADYRNIPYGEYTFKVRTIGVAKKWSKTFDYSFVIHPPWWHTWWARTSYGATAVLLFFGFVRLRTRNLKQRQKVLEQTVKERTTEVIQQKEEIEEKNEELVNQKEELNQQNVELETTLDHLKQTQSQLVQSEKMASLGQLIAGIAHEINTPLGAIKSSISTISETMKQSYKVLPELFRKLPEELMKEFILLLNESFASNGHYTTSEERKFKKTIIKKLEELNVENTFNIADTLVDMGIFEDISPFEKLLKDKNAETILNSAYSLSIQYKNSLNIETAVNKASKVVFALKNYSRYSTTETKVIANITEGIETVLTLYHNQLKHGIEIIKNFETIPEILCYPDELNQVWTNLIHNSIYAMQEKGILEITVNKTDTTIIVKIKDNGKGIPHEIKDKVFDAFFTTKPTGEGSGLGLDIVKKIIEKHDGSIDFESEEGKWTEFKVVLPTGIVTS